jgi:hypothetical protein
MRSVVSLSPDDLSFQKITMCWSSHFDFPFSIRQLGLEATETAATTKYAPVPHSTYKYEFKDDYG